MPAEHYENFPVASWLCPRPWRAPIMAIYRFARAADDLADEGDFSATQRLQALAEMRTQLQAALQGEPVSLACVADVAQAARMHKLPAQALFDLLDAFEQDCRQQRYADDAELLDYCRRSANPVGRLLLALWGQSNATTERWSDAICTGLQLINHWQDLGRDVARGRLYLPRATLQRFGVAEADVMAQRWSPALGALLAQEIERAMVLLRQGAPLAPRLGSKLGLELRFMVAGGLRIGERLQRNGHNPFAQRPHITWRDAPALLRLAWRAGG